MAGVRISAARITPLCLPLREPLPTAHGAVTQREGALLELETQRGARGCGEALPLLGFGLETPAEAARALEELVRELLGRHAETPAALLDASERIAPAAPAARAALDGAVHDLVARTQGVSLARWLARRAGTKPHARVPVAALVAAPDPQGAAAEARRRLAQGFRTLKLKLGASEFERDLERVAAVREVAGAEVALRLDANGAWKEADTPPRLRELARFGIEFLEQPVAAPEVEALARLRAAAPFPIAADEAVRSEGEADALLAARAADLLVLKPAAVGGLRVASHIAARARHAGVPVVVTSFLDSGLGRTAALHLAASLPGAPRAAGLATGELLREDLAASPPVLGGVIALPQGPGLGVAPEAEALQRCAAAARLELRA
jgi:o-succinylbenzoate synthase